MEKPLFFFHNSDLLPSSAPILTLTNRSFRYGDGLFESVRIINGLPFKLENHLERLEKGLRVLKMAKTPFLHYDFIYEQLEELCKKNNISEGGRARITVYREDGGLYSPEINNVSYLLEAGALSSNLFDLNKTGLKVDIYSDVKKPFNILSQIKSNNSLIYVLAGIFKNEKGLDDCILLNDENNISEAISSNLFMVSENKIYTPCIDQACIAGTMRKTIIELVKEMGYRVYECSLSPEDLNEASELFLTNSISGINWIGAFRQKRYFNSVSTRIKDKLNEKVLATNSSLDRLGN